MTSGPKFLCVLWQDGDFFEADSEDDAEYIRKDVHLAAIAAARRETWLEAVEMIKGSCWPDGAIDLSADELKDELLGPMRRKSRLRCPTLRPSLSHTRNMKAKSTP